MLTSYEDPEGILSALARRLEDDLYVTVIRRRETDFANRGEFQAVAVTDVPQVTVLEYYTCSGTSIFGGRGCHIWVGKME